LQDFPQSPNNETKNIDTYLRRQIRWVLLLRICLFSLILGACSFLQDQRLELHIPPFNVILTFIITVYLISIGSEFVLRITTHFRTFAYIQTLSDSLFITVLVFFTGANASIFSIIYFFPTVSSGIILRKTGGIILATVNVVLYGVVLFAEYIPIINSLPSPFSPNHFANVNVSFQALAVYGLSFYLTAMLSSLLSERFRRTAEKLNQTAMDLNRLNQLYKQIFNDITSGIITVDSDDKVTSFNVASEEITGFRQDEVLGRNISELLPILKSTLNNPARQSTTLIKKNRDLIQVGYSWAKLNLPGDCEDCRVFTLQDINKIKEMEAKVQQAEKMAAIGEIAAGIAHEFRNPLAAISGATQVLDQDPEQSQTNKSLLTIINREVRRLERNINDFLQFSKPSLPEKRWISIASLVEESLSVIRQIPGLKDNCPIKYDIPRNLACWADHHQMLQVFINLIHNSYQAMHKTGGEITISAKEIGTEKGQEKTIITLTDTGPGIKGRILPSVYQPFFTTKENGTGLGLAITKQIIESHEGEIILTSAPDTGTTATIILPIPGSDLDDESDKQSQVTMHSPKIQ
jgi:two-component system sensor histidine kinase PilS (NtrC family)